MSDRRRDMASVKEYGDNQLAPLYTWMSGDSVSARERFAHDIVPTRADSDWHMAMGVYQKIRLAPGRARDELAAAGLVIVKNTVQHGLVTLAAQRPVHA